VSQNKNDESFKVIDRRMFTSEGDLRPDAVEQDRSEKIPPAVLPTPAANPVPAATQSAMPAVAATAPPAEIPRTSASFQKLIDFLAQNAVVCLGVPDPRTGQAFIDLETARELIDMLEALREKSAGNLAPEDDRLLAEVLGQLQLTFLDRSQAVAKARREQPGAKP
jgi:hypothetical protein